MVSLPASLGRPLSTGLAFPYSAPCHLQYCPRALDNIPQGLLGPIKESHVELSGLEEVKSQG